jgi:hypothetical protein
VVGAAHVHVRNVSAVLCRHAGESPVPNVMKACLVFLELLYV